MSALGFVKSGSPPSHPKSPLALSHSSRPKVTTPIAPTPTSSALLSSSPSLLPPGLNPRKEGAQKNSSAPHESGGPGLNVRLGPLGNFCLLLLFFKLIRGRLGDYTAYASTVGGWFGK
jgi:hypothetical protein